jgi:NAD(P)-dependent dehydrogenase (short-subunit alcohol dehydrogenase family)
MRWVVTGANRGIGLEFARQLLARGDHVEALTRKPSEAEELRELCDGSSARGRVHPCDVTSDASVRAAAEAVGDVAVDVLVNNAGVMGKMQSLEELDLEDVTRTFDANALGPRSRAAWARSGTTPAAAPTGIECRRRRSTWRRGR